MADRRFKLKPLNRLMGARAHRCSPQKLPTIVSTSRGADMTCRLAVDLGILGITDGPNKLPKQTRNSLWHLQIMPHDHQKVHRSSLCSTSSHASHDSRTI